MYNLVTAHSFSSGDVLQKLARANEAVSFDPSFERERKILEAAAPTEVPIADIDISIGATWIPVKYYEDFCQEYFEVSVKFHFSPFTGSWEIELYSGEKAHANTSIYGYTYTTVDKKSQSETIHKIPAVGKSMHEGLFTMAMHFKVPRISDRRDRRAAALKQDELRRMWSDWCKEGDRGLELEKIYNQNFNRLVLANWDATAPANFRDVLRAAGMTGINKRTGLAWVESLRPYQLDTIWRCVVSGTNILVGLEVGLGKTLVAAAVVMLEKHYGISKKPMIVVQKSTLKQFNAAFREAFPKSKVLCATPEDCSAVNRQRFIAKAAFWDWDAIILTHESFKSIPTRKETEQGFINAKLAIVESELEALYAKGETSKKKGKKRGNRLVKKLEEMRDKLELRMDELRLIHDEGVYFEDIAPRKLVIDEAQKYKNNFFATKLQVKGISLSASDRAEDFDLKLSWMRRKHRRNYLVLMTGTPEPTNSMAGVYVMQMYLQPDELAERKLLHFDNWAVNFGKVVSKIEPGVNGDLTTSDRFAEFVNIPELLQMYLNVCHIKRFEDVAGQAGFTRPIAKVKKVSAPLSDAQITQMEWINYRYGCVRSDSPLKFIDRDKDGCMMSPKKEYKDKNGKTKLKAERLIHPITKQPIMEEREALQYKLEWGVKIDNHLWILTDARKLMVAPQLIDPNIPVGRLDKISQAVRRIHRIWRLTKAKKSTQLVFLDWGTPGGTAAFPLYKWIREKLIEKGIPKEEIAFIQDYSKDEDKEWLFDQVNAGEIRVVLGSTSPMGIGVNVQNKVIAEHFLDIPRRPDEYEQRMGRAVRSGNENSKVLIYQYITQGQQGNFGADAAQMGLLETKLKSREQVLRGDPTVRRVVEEDDQLLLFMMLTAHATGDARILRYMECKTDLEKQESKANLLLQEINRLNVGDKEGSINSIKRQVKNLEQDLGDATPDIKIAKAWADVCNHPNKFTCVVDGKEYTNDDDPNILEKLIAAAPCVANYEYKPWTVIRTQKIVDTQLRLIIERLKADAAQAYGSMVSKKDQKIGEYGGFDIYCRAVKFSDSVQAHLWLQANKLTYGFDYRTSELRLIRNLQEAFSEILGAETLISNRLAAARTRLQDLQAMLHKKRTEREAVVNTLNELNQEKSFLEAELSIRTE